MEESALQVEVAGPNLIVSGGGFCAVYYRATDRPQLVLRLQTKTDDHELLAGAWMIASAKARELGWIS
jgi:hypothetical protein